MRQESTAGIAAKNLRKALAAKFPGIKFRVTTSNYAGGSSINVRWTDGPNTAQVEPLANLFQQKDFNGMDDSTSYRGEAKLDGEVITHRAGYVFCNRDTSDEVLARHITALAADWGVAPISVEDYHQGRAHYWQSADGYDLSRALSSRLSKHSDRL